MIHINCLAVKDWKPMAGRNVKIIHSVNKFENDIRSWGNLKAKQRDILLLQVIGKHTKLKNGIWGGVVYPWRHNDGATISSCDELFCLLGRNKFRSIIHERGVESPPHVATSHAPLPPAHSAREKITGIDANPPWRIDLGAKVGRPK